MADQEHHHHTHHHGEGGAEEGKVEAKDRGLFDFMGKKEGQKPHEESKIATDFDQKVKIEESEEKKHGSLLEKLHRSDSSSSSSSEEEVEGEGGEKIKKKKKKGLKEKIKEKVEGDHQKGEEKAEHHDTTVPVEKEEAAPHAAETDEKKGFLDKIKDKLPGHKKPEDQAAVPESTPAPDHHGSAPAAEHHGHEGEAKEKKGILEKIKEKLPGYHPKSGEEEEKKETSAESH